VSLESHSEERSLVSYRSVDLAVSVVLLICAFVLGWDNLKLGAGWAPDGPESGYFPFYLSVILGIASIVGIVKALRTDGAESFVGRGQFKRVLQVAAPSIAYVAAIDFLGIYVASFLLISGFMIVLGKSKPIKSIITAAIFVAIMFYVFEVQFTVLLPKGPLENAIMY
jgi:hypothetical protein